MRDFYNIHYDFFIDTKNNIIFVKVVLYFIISNQLTSIKNLIEVRGGSIVGRRRGKRKPKWPTMINPGTTEAQKVLKMKMTFNDLSYIIYILYVGMYYICCRLPLKGLIG